MAHMAFAIWPTLLFFGLISATGSFVEDQSGLAGGSAVVESSLQSVSFDRAGKQHSGGSVLQGNPSDAGALSSNGLSSRARASSVARDPHTGSSLLLLTQEPNGLSAPTVDNARQSRSLKDIRRSSSSSRAEARSSPATILALSPAAFLEKSLFRWLFRRKKKERKIKAKKRKKQKTKKKKKTKKEKKKKTKKKKKDESAAGEEASDDDSKKRKSRKKKKKKAKDRETQGHNDDDDMDERPLRRRTRRHNDDDDMDERPLRRRTRRHIDDDDMDERPLRRRTRRHIDDDDMDERPLRRRTRRHIDDDDMDEDD